jgi:hypothetical protein
MAVPPVAAKVLFEAILKTFAGVQYESVQPSIAPMIHLKGTLESFSRVRQSSDNPPPESTKKLISLAPGVE